MQEDIVLLLLGFLLTTVLGGALVHYFQNRAWKHQHELSLFEAQRETATAVFEQLSTIMDKRLYRMRLVRWRLDEESENKNRIDDAMDGYRSILYEWNDNLNRNSALVQRYFGVDTRVQLEDTIYEEFARIGKAMEQCYRSRDNSKNSISLVESGIDLDALSDTIYLFNVSMLRQIQEGRIGLMVVGNNNVAVGAIQEERLGRMRRDKTDQVSGPSKR